MQPIPYKLENLDQATVTVNMPSRLVMLPEELILAIAEYLSFSDLARYIQELTTKKGSICISKLNAKLIDKIQLEKNSSSSILELGKIGRAALFQRLLGVETTRSYVKRLDFKQVGVQRDVFIEMAQACPSIEELNMGTIFLSDVELQEFIGHFSKLHRLGYADLSQLIHSKYLGSACLEIGEGRVPIYPFSFEKIWKVYVDTVIKNPHFFSDMKILDFQAINPRSMDFEQIFIHSPNLIEVNLSNCQQEALSVLSFLPKKIKKLNLSRHSLNEKNIQDLPKSLTHLSFFTLSFQAPEEIFKSFSSLIELKIGRVSPFPKSCLSHLPTSLKKLHVGEYIGNGNIIRSLPSTLEELDIMAQMGGDIFENKDLPQSLTCLSIIIQNMRPTERFFESKWPPNLLNLTLSTNTIRQPFAIPNSIKKLKLIMTSVLENAKWSLLQIPVTLDEVKFEKAGWVMFADNSKVHLGTLYRYRLLDSDEKFELPPPIPLPLSLKRVVLPRISDYLPCVDPYKLFSGYNQDFRVLLPMYTHPGLDEDDLAQWCKQHKVKLIA